VLGLQEYAILVLLALTRTFKLYSWAGEVAQVVKHLPSKYKVLRSNPSAEKEKKEKDM
jgi:hypothetical protein